MDQQFDRKQAVCGCDFQVFSQPGRAYRTAMCGASHEIRHRQETRKAANRFSKLHLEAARMDVLSQQRGELKQ